MSSSQQVTHIVKDYADSLQWCSYNSWSDFITDLDLIIFYMWNNTQNLSFHMSYAFKRTYICSSYVLLYLTLSFNL